MAKLTMNGMIAHQVRPVDNDDRQLLERLDHVLRACWTVQLTATERALIERLRTQAVWSGAERSRLHKIFERAMLTALEYAER